MEACPKEIAMNIIDEVRFENAQNEAQTQWRQISAVAHLPQGLQFTPLAAQLMIIEIFEGDENVRARGIALDPLPGQRLAQFANAWTETPNGRTIPVGVLLVGRADDGTNRGVDQVRFVPAAVRLLAEIFDWEVSDMTDRLGDLGAEAASTMLRNLDAWHSNVN
jgi:hypothetical protein